MMGMNAWLIPIEISVLKIWFVHVDFVGFVWAPSCLYDRHLLFLDARFWGAIWSWNVVNSSEVC